MKYLAMLATLTLFAACSVNEEKRQEQNLAIRDLIEVNELEELDALRFQRRLSAYEINEYFVIAGERDKRYLLEYTRRCYRDPITDRVEPDVRYDAHTIRARFDTFRGCRIKAIYAIDEALEGELKAIGKAPGE